MKKSSAQLKKEQRDKNKAMGRTVRFERMLTPSESKLMAAHLNSIRD